jgi:hypothetical protein
VAQFTYVTTQQVGTVAARHSAYTDKIPSFLIHLDALGVTLLSLSWDPATKLVTVTIDTALTPEQLIHLGFQ